MGRIGTTPPYLPFQPETPSRSKRTHIERSGCRIRAQSSWNRKYRNGVKRKGRFDNGRGGWHRTRVQRRVAQARSQGKPSNSPYRITNLKFKVKG
ncbi:unnamed protein product, partial [Brenthis ino]